MTGAGGRGALARDLAAIVGARHVRSAHAERVTYSMDGLPTHRRLPDVVVLPGTREELIAIIRLLATLGVPFVPRGAGTGLSGGALAGSGAVLLVLTRLNRILRVDPANRVAVVEPGVVNAKLSSATRPHGLHYAPDPSSQTACTIGGNVAENAGGPHCLKYGVTANHVLALEVVLADGQVVELGSPGGEPGGGGPDLVGLFVGSEGNFGVATRITVRLTPLPRAVRTLLADFTSLRAAGEGVSAIIAAGIVPAALEMMDQSCIRAVEDSVYAAGYPRDAAAVLLVELDGRDAAAVTSEADAVAALLGSAGARTIRTAADEAERERLWQGRKKAFGAMGRLSRDLVVQDAVVPRSALPDVLETIAGIAARHGLVVSNVFHAGDGNLHPNISFDATVEAVRARVEIASGEIMAACIAAGGTITGEHGVGLDKLRYMPLIFDAESLGAMHAVRRVFDPEERVNPGKVVPVHACREWSSVRSAGWGVQSDDGNSAPRTLGDAMSIQDKVRALLGEAAVLEQPAPGGIPRIAPGSPDAVALLLATAHREGWRVRIEGAGTWLQGDAPADLAITTRRLDRVPAIEPQDLTATVEAGIGLDQLRQQLADRGAWLALDPPGLAGRTLGSVVASGTAGPLRQGFGPVKDHLLGVTFVTGDGRMVQSGGRVMKNVAGYDLTRLQAGGFGAFGVIVLVHLRLRALPRADVTHLLEGPREDLTQVAEDIAAAGLTPAALELVSPALARREHWVLAVRLAGSPALVSADETGLGAATAGRFTALRAEEAHGFWMRLAEGFSVRPVTFRIGAVPAASDEMLDLLQHQVGDEWISAAPAAGAIRWTGDTTVDRLQRLRRSLAGLEVPLTLERAPWPIRSAVGHFGAYREGVGPLVAGLRRTFDPGSALVVATEGE